MLPAHASTDSQTRFAIAQRCASACPPALADAIAVCGSTARGWSDTESDIEMNFWVETVPALADRLAWLESIGVRDQAMDPDAHWDGSQWITGTIQADSDAIAVERLLSGGLTERAFTFLGDLLIHAVPLRPSDRLSGIVARLRDYPDAVQDAQITAGLRPFMPGHGGMLRRLAARGETLTLNMRLNDDLEAALSLIYAAHRRWMPTRKWTLTVARAFAPGDWLLRCDAALCVVDPLARIDAVLSLVGEALALLPAHSVSDAVRAAVGR